MAFAFSGPTSIEVRQGESATATFRILATSKPYRNVSLNISGLPSGVSFQFSPISGKPTFNSTLTLRASLTSTVGNFTAIVTARDAKSSKSITLMGTLLRALNRPEPTIEPGDIHVATTGNDTTGDGSIGNPYATIQKAHDVAVAGNLIYVRGGTYNVSAPITLTKDGSSGNLFRLFAYPGETPVINGSGITTTSGVENISTLVLLSANWWHIKGLTVTGGISDSVGILIYQSGANACSNNVIERCIAHDNNGTGIGAFANNSGNISILNNDSYDNSLGGNADGFQMSVGGGGTNTFSGNRAWGNSDDGFDFFNVAGTSPWTIDNNWAWSNGGTGDGNGFKLGGGGASSGGHTVTRNLSFNNFASGFTSNDCNLPLTIYNNTAYNNTSDGFFTNVTTAHVIRNNLTYLDTVSINAESTHDHNSWDSAVTVNSSDFQSLDDTQPAGTRQSDGSLPNITFMHLLTGDLIDAGTTTGLPANVSYLGANPDMGCFEKE